MPISNQTYSRTSIKRSYIHTAVSERFLSDNHSENHMLLIPIEKLKTGRNSIIEPPLSGHPLLSGRQSKSRNKCRKEWGIEPLLSKRGNLLASLRSKRLEVSGHKKEI